MKPRKPLRRRTPLKASVKPCCGKSLCQCGKPPSLAPGKPMERKPIAPVNRKRKAQRFESDYGGKAYVEHLHSMGCAVCEVSGWTEAAHVKSRGAGGKAKDLVPLCGDRLGVVGCHRLLDTAPWELPEGTAERLRALAKKLWAAWESRVEP